MPEIKTKAYRRKMGGEGKAYEIKKLDDALVSKVIANLPDTGQGKVQSSEVSPVTETLWSWVYRLYITYEGGSTEEFVIKEYKEPKKNPEDIYLNRFKRRTDLHRKEVELLRALEYVPSLRDPENVKGAPKVYWFSERDKILVMEACDGSVEDLLKEVRSGHPYTKETRHLVGKIVARCLEAIIRADLKLNIIKNNPEIRGALARNNEDQRNLFEKITDWLNKICSYDFYKKTGINRYRDNMRPEDTANYDEWQGRLSSNIILEDILGLARYAAPIKIKNAKSDKPVSHTDCRASNLVYRLLDKGDGITLADKILANQATVLVIDPTKAREASPSIDVAMLLLDLLTYTNQDPQRTKKRFKNAMNCMKDHFVSTGLPAPYVDINLELLNAFTFAFLRCVSVAMYVELKYPIRYRRITEQNQLLSNEVYIPSKMRFIYDLLKSRRELPGIKEFLFGLEGIKSMVASQKRSRRKQELKINDIK